MTMTVKKRFLSTMFERAEAYDTMIARSSELIPHDLAAAKKIVTEFYLDENRLINEKNCHHHKAQVSRNVVVD